MKKIFMIALGGFLGAILRYLIKSIPVSSDFPFTTLLVNTIGCFILAFVSSFTMKPEKADLKLGITTGFCGAFTTFSTLCKESVLFITRGYYSNSIFYLISLITLGLSAVYIGISLADMLNNRKEEADSFLMNDAAKDEVD